jgi:hypothetical protein
MSFWRTSNNRPHSLSGNSFPYHSISFRFELDWEVSNSNEFAIVSRACVNPKWENTTWPTYIVPLNGHTKYSVQNRKLTLPLVLLVTPQFVETIENHRQGNGGLRIAGYVDIDFEHKSEQRGVEKRSEQVYFDLQFDRESWLAALNGLGIANTVIIEMNLQAVEQLPKYKAAIDRFNKAQTYMRNGQWESVCIECFKSIEDLLAQEQIKDLDKKDLKDFPAESQLQQKVLALCDRLFPETKQADQRDALGWFVRGLMELRNSSGHGDGGLTVPLGRHDAELTFSITGNIYRYIGQQLASIQRRQNVA